MAMLKTEESPELGALAAAACHEPFLGAWAELECPSEQSLIDVLRAGAERHRELIGTVGLHGDTPADEDARSERLLEYRRGVDTLLLDPMSKVLSERGPVATVGRMLDQARERSIELTRWLPAETVAPWPSDALEPLRSDGWRRRLGKGFARLFSSARKAGQERSLPFRNVVMGHLDRVVIPAQDEVGAQALVAWAEWSRQLEAVWAEWGAVALPALVRAEAPSEDVDQAQERWEAVRGTATALQTGLEELLESDPRPHLAGVARARLETAYGSLEADLAAPGSFLLEPAAPPTVATLRRVERFRSALTEWDAGVAARLRLYLSLLSILSGATAVQRRMVWRFRERCLARLSELSDIAVQLDGLDAGLRESAPSDTSEGAITDLDAAVGKALEPAPQAIPQPSDVDSAVREISDSTIEALLAMIRQAPASLVLHASGTQAPSGGRRAETRTLPLQELARESFDALRIERIRSSSEGLLEALDEARTHVTELEEVFRFARDEALRELEAGEEGAPERARDLVSGALSSVAEALRSQVANLDAAVMTAQGRLASEISDGSSALLERVGAGRMEARLFAARSRLANLRAWVNDTMGPPVDRAGRWMAARLTRLRRLGATARRRGSAIVGSGPAESAASTRTLRALADPKSATSNLPLVYQRLFTLDPITDTALLAGRDAELTNAMLRWKRWHDADGVPLIIRGRQGSGITSFLNVLAAEIEEDGGSVKQATLLDRVTDEETLAKHLAKPLGLAPVTSLDELAHAIFDTESSALPAAVALDDLEHLYLRVPRGTDLIERLLTLMSETEPRVFWIAGITSSAWQLVATAEPSAISQVDVFDLPPLTALAMRTAITVRHRRSGLAIRYDEPTAGRHLLRRRLRRMRDADGYQAVLEEDYFDRLHRTSGGYLGLALYQWLLSADFESGEGVLMRQPERPDFSVLHALDLNQNFTLKAFLEHRSLTLDEHDRIFRLPRQESYQILESLRNRHLLEPVLGSENGADTRSEIEEELRYRVRPLLTGAVISHLQGLNIVH